MKLIKNLWIISFLFLALNSCKNELGEKPNEHTYRNSRDNATYTIFESGDLPISRIREDYGDMMCGGFTNDSPTCIANKDLFLRKTNFNADNIGKALDITSIKFLSLTYPSHIKFKRQDLNTETSGLLIIPKIGKNYISYNKIKGVVLYFHPTAFDKSGVPSMNYHDNRTKQDTLYAAIYAAQGYIVVAPDYIGQG